MQPLYRAFGDSLKKIEVKKREDKREREKRTLKLWSQVTAPVTSIRYKRRSDNHLDSDAVNVVIPRNDWIHTYKGVLYDLQTAAQLTPIPQNYLPLPSLSPPSELCEILLLPRTDDEWKQVDWVFESSSVWIIRLVEN